MKLGPGPLRLAPVGGPAQALLVLAPGAGLPPEAYQELAQEIQQGSPLPLEICIPRFLGNVSNPWQLARQFDQCSQEFRREHPQAPVLLGGHSLGGVLAQRLAPQRDCQGTVLLSAYPTEYPLDPKAEQPCLAVSGELDGLTRLTQVAAKAPETIVLPGLNHSSFADGRKLRSDLPAEVPHSQARAQVAQLVDGFIAQVALGHEPQPEQVQAQQVSQELLAPYQKALQLESTWAGQMHRVLSHAGVLGEAHSPPRTEDAGVLGEAPELKTLDNLWQFAWAKPSEDQQLQRLQQPFGLWGIPAFPHSTRSIASKIKGPVAAEARQANQLALDWALEQVGPEARQRYLERGKPLQLAADQPRQTGASWLASGLVAKEEDSRLQVASPTLVTSPEAPFGLDQLYYTKLLSPTRAMEWVLIDGLRDQSSGKGLECFNYLTGLR